MLLGARTCCVCVPGRQQEEEGEQAGRTQARVLWSLTLDRSVRCEPNKKYRDDDDNKLRSLIMFVPVWIRAGCFVIKNSRLVALG